MDIYFTKEWGIVNKYIEPGEPQEFVMKSENGVVRNLFILREIPIKVDGVTYFDIASPYGYGGPYIVEVVDGKKEELVKEYYKKFSEYCVNNCIVSEFIRFHPIVGNGVEFKDVYNVIYDRHTVGTDLTVEGDPVESEFSKSAKKYIRRALKAGVTWSITLNPPNIDDFIEIYYSTMDRDSAEEMYYFPKEYFDRCLELFGDHILYVRALFKDKTIAAGFYICYGETIHAHLSGTLKEYLHLSPAYVIKYATAEWGKEHGCKLVHYGGGTSADEENSLYQFKLKFTKCKLFDFYLGKKIWNQTIYDELVRINNSPETEYFPRYRVK